MEAVMREHFDVATRAVCGNGALPRACLAGVVTLLLGGACLAYAFIVPGLFGPVAAAVVAAERLLCAACSSTTAAPLARGAAVVAIELMVIGVVRLLQAGSYRHGDSVTHAAPRLGATDHMTPGTIEPETAMA
jgi:hypothetical protein